MGRTKSKSDSSIKTVDPPGINETASSDEMIIPESAPPAESSVASSRTDYEYSLILETYWYGIWRWRDDRQTWMRWNTRFWEEATEHEAARTATEDLRGYLENELIACGDDDLEAKMSHSCFARDVSTFSRVRSVLKYLKGSPKFQTRSGEWDADESLLNLANGMLDLSQLAYMNPSELKLNKHDPEALCTRMAPVFYDPTAEALEWNTHLEYFIEEPDVRREIQRGLGLSLVGTSLVEVLHVWFGLGANGKSTTANVIQKLLGKYSGQAAPNLLVQNGRQEHPTEIADLCGKRLAFSSETAHESKLDEAKVKQLTGGDIQKARYMRKDYFEFKQTWTLFLLCNHKPSIQGTDNGIWRRVRFIPWSRHIEPSKQKPQDEVTSKLLNEKSGILNWLIEGLADYYEDPQWLSETVRDETDIYRSEQDMIRDFLEDCCQIGRGQTVSVKDLYEAYQQWCAIENEHPQSKKTFGSRLKGRGGIKGAKGTAGVRIWTGLALKPDITLDNKTIHNS